MSVFGSKMRVYLGKWESVKSEKLDEEDLSTFTGAKVVSSQYGLSVCFFVMGGGTSYLPISINSKEVHVGDPVDLKTLEVETLHREGDEDIYRALIK